MIRIAFVADIVCPWCLIGKRRLEAALRQRPQLVVEIDWWPFQLHPDMPREGLDRRRAIAAKFGSAENARRVYEHIAAVGREVGIAFDFDAIPRTPNTLDAHRLIHWADRAGVDQAGADQTGVRDAVVESLFRRFFMNGEDIGDPRVLATGAEEAGLDGAAILRRLATDDDLELIRSRDRRARELGIDGVPAMIFDDRHLVSGAQPPEVLLQVLDRIAG